MKKPPHRPEAEALQGHRAGFVSRAAAAVIDLGAVTLLGLGCLIFAALVRYAVLGGPVVAPTMPRWLSITAGAVIPIAYLAIGWAIAGRTVGMQVLGLRLISRSGRHSRPAAALLRAVLCVAFPVGLLWALFSRRNASLQDLILGTSVIYDWSYGAVEPPAERAPEKVRRAE